METEFAVNFNGVYFYFARSIHVVHFYHCHLSCNFAFSSLFGLLKSMVSVSRLAFLWVFCILKYYFFNVDTCIVAKTTLNKLSRKRCGKVKVDNETVKIASSLLPCKIIKKLIWIKSAVITCFWIIKLLCALEVLTFRDWSVSSPSEEGKIKNILFQHKRYVGFSLSYSSTYLSFFFILQLLRSQIMEGDPA